LLLLLLLLVLVQVLPPPPPLLLLLLLLLLLVWVQVQVPLLPLLLRRIAAWVQRTGLPARLLPLVLLPLVLLQLLRVTGQPLVPCLPLAPLQQQQQQLAWRDCCCHVQGVWDAWDHLHLLHWCHQGHPWCHPAGHPGDLCLGCLVATPAAASPCQQSG
jgi:hypothetical protein